MNKRWVCGVVLGSRPREMARRRRPRDSRRDDGRSRRLVVLRLVGRPTSPPVWWAEPAVVQWTAVNAPYLPFPQRGSVWRTNRRASRCHLFAYRLPTTITASTPRSSTSSAANTIASQPAFANSSPIPAARQSPASNLSNQNVHHLLLWDTASASDLIWFNVARMMCPTNGRTSHQ